MKVSIDTKSLEKTLLNIVKYSSGFLDGVQAGKKVFLNNMGRATIEALNQYIDANARMNDGALHHIYEWYRVGSPDARLFNINYTVSNLGLSLKSTFSQSRTIQDKSKEPFYDKTRIMEQGIPVTIAPKRNSALVFESGGEEKFIRRPITIQYPGGPEVRGSYEKVFDTFFSQYFSQAFLRASGLIDYLSSPVLYKKNFADGAKKGRSSGVKTGYTWIANAKIGVEG